MTTTTNYRGKQIQPTAKQLFDDRVRKKMLMALAASELNTTQLAKATGIPYGTLNNILRGKHATSPYYISKICTVLGIDANFLLGVKRDKEKVDV